MEVLDKELINELITSQHQLCISLYMPTHRTHPEKQQDHIRFRNLIKQMTDILNKSNYNSDIDKIKEPFENLLHNIQFWNHTQSGLAVFASDNMFKIVKLQESVDELVIVADTFHTKPVRQYLQSMDNFYVLELHRDHVKLYSGNRHQLNPIKFPADFPQTITDALGEELTDSHLTVATYNGVGGSADMFHGHGGRKDEIDKDSQRFFRVIANEVYQRYSKNSDWPLILAALPEHHNLFHRVSKNPMLLEKGIQIDPSSVSLNKLAQQAWEVMEPMYRIKIKELIERFSLAKARGVGSDDLREVAKATLEGRVDTLVVEAGKIIQMSINQVITQRDDLEEKDKQGVDDLLDDLGEEVVQRSGTVLILPKEDMPTDSGLAAIYRY